MDNSVLLSGYEKRILENKKKTDADLLKDNKLFTNRIKNHLSIEIETVDEEGVKTNESIVDILVAKKIGYLMDHPEKIDLKEISSVLGENKIEVETNFKSASELFDNLVIKSEEDSPSVEEENNVVEDETK